MEGPEDALEALWDDLLSGQPERVRRAFGGLSEEERQAVMAHLRRMASESGWQPEQRESARLALAALE